MSRLNRAGIVLQKKSGVFFSAKIFVGDNGCIFKHRVQAQQQKTLDNVLSKVLIAETQIISSPASTLQDFKVQKIKTHQLANVNFFLN